MTKPTGLAEPLARALDDSQWYQSQAASPLSTILSRLRSDPQTLAVIAEALEVEGLDSPANQSYHGWRCTYPDRYGPCDCFDRLVASLADALFGAPQ